MVDRLEELFEHEDGERGYTVGTLWLVHKRQCASCAL